MHTGASLMGRVSHVLLPLFVTSASVSRAPMAQTKWLAGIWCNLHLTTKSWRLFLWSRCWWAHWRRSWLGWTAGNGVCDPHTSKVAARVFLPNGDKKSSLFSFVCLVSFFFFFEKVGWWDRQTDRQTLSSIARPGCMSSMFVFCECSSTVTVWGNHSTFSTLLNYRTERGQIWRLSLDIWKSPWIIPATLPYPCTNANYSSLLTRVITVGTVINGVALSKQMGRRVFVQGSWGGIFKWSRLLVSKYLQSV